MIETTDGVPDRIKAVAVTLINRMGRADALTFCENQMEVIQDAAKLIDDDMEKLRLLKMSDFYEQAKQIVQLLNNPEP